MFLCKRVSVPVSACQSSFPRVSPYFKRSVVYFRVSAFISERQFSISACQPSFQAVSRLFQPVRSYFNVSGLILCKAIFYCVRCTALLKLERLVKFQQFIDFRQTNIFDKSRPVIYFLRVKLRDGELVFPTVFVRGLDRRAR